MCNTTLYNIRSQCNIGFAGRRSNDFGIVILCSLQIIAVSQKSLYSIAEFGRHIWS